MITMVKNHRWKNHFSLFDYPWLAIFQLIYVRLWNDSYVLKNPFVEKMDVIILGGNCSICQQPVCMNQKCSLFSDKSLYCLPCATSKLEDLPEELKKDVMKIPSKSTWIKSNSLIFSLFFVNLNARLDAA